MEAIFGLSYQTLITGLAVSQNIQELVNLFRYGAGVSQNHNPVTFFLYDLPFYLIFSSLMGVIMGGAVDEDADAWKLSTVIIKIYLHCDAAIRAILRIIRES